MIKKLFSMTQFLVNCQLLILSQILQCVKSLKRNKSVGEDAIANEYIISTIDVMMPLYVALFNTIFDTGVIPSCWLVGDTSIVPFNKKKGDTKNPKN